MSLFDPQKQAQNMDQHDVANVLANGDAIRRKAARGPLARFSGTISTLFSLVMDYMSGEYPYVPWSTIAWISATLLYVLSPVDLVPDIIPVAGLADDAAFVAGLVAAIAKDLDNYARWKASHESEQS